MHREFVSRPVSFRAGCSFTVNGTRLRCESSEHRLSSGNAREFLVLTVPSVTRFLGNVLEESSCGRPLVRDTFA